jgi:hypothetical protein
VFNNRTLIVVGAGASSECNLPTGLDLRTQIARLLDIRFPNGFEMKSGDALICNALRLHVQKQGSRDINPYLHAGWRIRDAMPQAISIDNFIDSHQGDKKLELCGKLGIVRSILEAERRSSLHVDMRSDRRHPNYSNLGETWYAAFMQLLTQNCRIEQLPERLSKITFVVFNYDRCVEHFLFHGIQNYYGINDSAAAEALRSLSIFHPYGSVGHLPWQRTASAVEFGGTPSTGQLLELAGGIKTFTEGTDPTASDIKAIRQHFQEATVLLFLGFAFHRTNLALLKPDAPHSSPNDVRYFGTAAGMSNSDCEVVREDLVALASARPERIVLRNDLKCGPFFREYWRSLSLG